MFKFTRINAVFHTKILASLSFEVLYVARIQAFHDRFSGHVPDAAHWGPVLQ